jgi:hypothetical protein
MDTPARPSEPPSLPRVSASQDSKGLGPARGTARSVLSKAPYVRLWHRLDPSLR